MISSSETERTTESKQTKTAEAKSRATEVTTEAKEAARRAADDFKHEASRATAELRDAAYRAKGEATSRLSETVLERKGAVAEQVATFGTAARDAANRLKEDGSPGFEYLESAADSLDRTADYLRNADLRDLYEGAEQFTRRHPEVVLGGLFVVGLGIARFLKASNENRYASRNFENRGYPAFGEPQMRPVARYGSDHMYSTHYPSTPESTVGPAAISVGGADRSDSTDTELAIDPVESITSSNQRAPR